MMVAVVCAASLAAQEPGGQPGGDTAQLAALADVVAYSCTLSRHTREAFSVAGEVQGWSDAEAEARLICRPPEWYRVATVLPDQMVLPSRGRRPQFAPSESSAGATPAVLWFCSPDIGLAGTMDLREVRDLHGDVKVRELRRGPRTEADALFWLESLDRETAKVVEEKEVPLAEEGDDGDEGGTETLYVIEGTPKDAALLAEAEKRKDLPIEPLLRITLGADGFPRHVLVQCYCPRWDVLELTVTDYELNPDLPDDLFEFKPPEGVQVIEADPANWK
jgi:hypothetical protein